MTESQTIEAALPSRDGSSDFTQGSIHPIQSSAGRGKVKPKSIQTAKRRLVHKLFQFLRAPFYRLGFVRQIPFAAELEKIITSWEKHQRGYIPISADRWEAQYLGGRWVYLNQLEELARYTVIVGYIAYLKPRGAVLDVGCGEGILFERYRPYGYSKYLGIDISEAALAKLAEPQNENTVFIKADAEAYRQQSYLMSSFSMRYSIIFANLSPS